jgi:hypothetical protein
MRKYERIIYDKGLAQYNGTRNNYSKRTVIDKARLLETVKRYQNGSCESIYVGTCLLRIIRSRTDIVVVTFGPASYQHWMMRGKGCVKLTILSSVKGLNMFCEKNTRADFVNVKTHLA